AREGTTNAKDIKTLYDTYDAPNTQFEVVPSLRSWVGGQGGLVLSGSSRVVVAAGDKGRYWSGDWFSTVLGGLLDPDGQGLADDVRAARRLALADSKWAVPYFTSSQRTLLQVAGKVKADLKLQTGLDLLVVVAGENGVTPAAGDVVLNISDVADSALSAEGYELAVTDRVVLSANSSSGVFYGSRTLLQALRLSDDGVTVPQGTARDWPTGSQGVRMVHSDVSRTFWEPSYLADSMREMSWAKLNTYYWHLSERNSFRLHDPDKYCKTVDGEQVCLATPKGYYTKADVDALVAVAAEHHIAIVPGINVPGHADPITTYFGIAAACYGNYYIDMSAKAWTDVGGLITNFAAWFPGPYFGLGGDEIFSQFNSCSTTTAAIQRVAGVSTAADLINKFLNDMDDIARGLGKRSMLYNGFEGNGSSPNVSLSRDVLLMPWDKDTHSSWNGYDTVNLRWVPHKLYLVLGPRSFDIPLQSKAQAEVIPLERTNEIGTGIAVWADASHWAEGAYIEGLLKRPRALLGDRLWANTATADEMDVFEARLAAVGRPPGYVGFPDVRVDDGSPNHYYTFDAAKAKVPGEYIIGGGSGGLGERVKIAFDEIAGAHGQGYGPSDSLSDRPRIDTSDAQVGDSFEFYNVGERVHFAHGDIAPPWTVSAWVKRTGSVNNATLLSSLDYRLHLQTGNTSRVGVFNRKETPREVPSSYTLPLNTWVYLTFVGSATDTKIYANGVLQDTLNVVVPLPRQAIGIMRSGRYDRDRPGQSGVSTTPVMFRGKLDELKMWDQTLTADQILARYESYDDPAYEHLVHLWSFNDGAGSYVSDIGRRHTAGTITGASWQTTGVDGGAISLDGTGDWIHTGADSLPAADGWTAALWVKRTATTGDAVLFAPASGSAGQIKLETGNANRISIGGNTFAYTAPADQWTHLTLVGDSSSVTLYVNGANPITVNTAHPLALARIGAKTDDTLTANTWLDDIRIYNKTLNNTQIQTLYGTYTAPSNSAELVVVEPVVSAVGVASNKDLVVEGDDAVFMVSVDPAPTVDLTVMLDIEETHVSGNSETAFVTLVEVIVPAGETSASYTYTTHEDQTDRPAGTVVATIQPTDHYTVSNKQNKTIITITDDDATVVTLSGGGAVVEADTTTAEITVMLSRVLVVGETVEVPLVISGDSINTDDFVLTLKTGVGINSGVTLSEQTTLTPSVTLTGADAQTATLILTAVDDDAVESAETATVTLGNLADVDLTTNLGGGVEPSDDQDPDTVDNQVDIIIDDEDTTDDEDTENNTIDTDDTDGDDDSDDTDDADDTDEGITLDSDVQQAARKDEEN
ncbi:MAG: family 20 glycosylhydrolase, partial [Acidimicrobiia bacterium]|nr:family 20 glycosylhydrolase [Acidimicrobiia bacterium]